MAPDAHFENVWANYEIQPSFVLGFHGCDAEIGEALLRGDTPHLLASDNEYDWLGSGVYFWEGSPQRAYEFALERAAGGRNSKGKIKNPFVLGAILNLKHCLDLADSSAILDVQKAYSDLSSAFAADSVALPQNKAEKRYRGLDCLVFNWLHETRKINSLPAFDTVRGLFLEGQPIYKDAGVLSHNHIQICVRNPECILGYFRPILTGDT